MRDLRSPVQERTCARPSNPDRAAGPVVAVAHGCAPTLARGFSPASIRCESAPPPAAPFPWPAGWCRRAPAPRPCGGAAHLGLAEQAQLRCPARPGRGQVVEARRCGLGPRPGSPREAVGPSWRIAGDRQARGWRARAGRTRTGPGETRVTRPVSCGRGETSLNSTSSPRTNSSTPKRPRAAQCIGDRRARSPARARSAAGAIGCGCQDSR